MPLHPIPLNATSFAPYGQILQPPSSTDTTPTTGTITNQGTATKYPFIPTLPDFYHLSPTRKPARPQLSLFVCRPHRSLRQGRYLAVAVLERHPYTSQTFVPCGVDASARDVRYLVIVAPTLPERTTTTTTSITPPYPIDKPRRRPTLTQRLLSARPNPFTNDFAPSTTTPSSNFNLPSSMTQPQGPGGPDLSRLQVFVGRGDQAVSYGPGTWHSPMVVVGDREMQFVVVQFANGVEGEDCQEVRVEGKAIEVDLAEEVASKL